MLTYTEARTVLEALSRLFRYFPNDTDMRQAGWDGLVIERACLACDDARTAAALLRSRLEKPQDGWQPIETAPKDGTVVLLYSPSRARPGGDVFAGSWGHGDGLNSCNVADERYPWLAFDPGTDGLNAYMLDRITHWMPLPPPPSQDRGAEGEKK